MDGGAQRLRSGVMEKRACRIFGQHSQAEPGKVGRARMQNRLAGSNGAKLVALAIASYRPDLTEAERSVLEDSARKASLKVRPGDKPEHRHTRADFFRWLLNDPRVTPLIDKDGLQVTAATIDGDIDLDSVQLTHDLTFQRCIFAGACSLRGASLRSLVVSESMFKMGLNLAGAQVSGEVRLSPGVESAGQVTLYGARVDGDLTLSAAKLNGVGDAGSLLLSKADIKGVVYMDELQCAGKALMQDVKFGSKVLVDEARFGATLLMVASTFAASLYLAGVQVKDEMLLSNIAVTGGVNLLGGHLGGKPESLTLRNATIGGDVVIAGAEGAPLSIAGTVSAAQAVVKQSLIVFHAELPRFDLSNADVGTFKWGQIEHPERTKLILTRTTVKGFVDEKKSWPAKGNLSVEGFTYGQIALEVPNALRVGQEKDPQSGGGMDPSDRIAWLKLQSDQSQSVSQPWLELSQFVRARGNVPGAKRVIYEMKRMQARRSGVGTRTTSWIYDIIEENPLRLFLPVCLLWMFGWVIFWRARRMAAMAPTEKEAFAHFEEHGKEPGHYPPFSAAVYTLENVLPVVKLGQDAAWAPNPRVQPPRRNMPHHLIPRWSYGWLAALRWSLIVIGWVMALILAGAIGEQFKS